MTDRKLVTIELTEGQRAKITSETGRVVETLTFDALEDRIAPSMTKLPRDPRVVNSQ
jgi:hypothetical protein